ncbi:MAG TPA: NADH-quinone oxidoreductase subunit NuoH [Dehalococcoidia bacterium]|nr:NADH-quinone oxidoreductase subunit NuoH [Dehalococcoidia bacterium]
MSALETFFDNVWVDALWRLLAVLGLMVIVVLALTYVERKFVGRIQMRLGPMRTGPYGIMQPIADMVKILLKEDLRPASADRIAFELAPFLAFVPAFLTLLVLPFTAKWDVRVLDLGLLYFIAVSGLTVLGYVFAGWASDNKYALIGALRVAAQLISYEVPLVLAVLALAMLAGSLNLVEIVEKQGRVPFIVWQPLGFFLFMAAAVSDLTRRPFDVAAAESEVAGGPWIEFSGIRWSILYALTEYTNMFALCTLGSLIFLGGWNWPLGLEWGWWWQLALIFAKTSALILVVMWVNATFPRVRVDQLMSFCWKLLLPLAFVQVFLNGLILVYDWPDWTFLVTSGLALAAAGYIVYSVLPIGSPSRMVVRSGA